MPIDRTAFNALVDDNGSNNGTVWNKGQIKNALLDPIDAAFVALPPGGLPVGFGTWTGFAPTVTTASGSLSAINFLNLGYTMLGTKTMILSFYFQFTLSSAVSTKLFFTLPVGYTSIAAYQAGGIWANRQGFGLIQLDPANSTKVTLLRDTLGSATIPIGVNEACGVAIFQVT